MELMGNYSDPDTRFLPTSTQAATFQVPTRSFSRIKKAADRCARDVFCGFSSVVLHLYARYNTNLLERSWDVVRRLTN